jgi:hypothetical protein
VWYINGLLNLARQTGSRHWLSLAKQLTAKQQQLFQDSIKGGYYEAGSDKNLLFRSKSAYDGALPAPNAIAIENLQLLAELTDENAWQQMATGVLDSFAVSINNDPGAAAWMLSRLKDRDSDH